MNKKQKTVPTNFNEKTTIYKIENFYILIEFLLIRIALLMYLLLPDEI